MSLGQNIELLNKGYEQSLLTFKIIVLGDSFVGKSCLTLKAVKGVMDKNYKSTVGFEFLDYSVKLENYNVKLQIWDTCGQETYRSLISSFYHSSSLAILVYSIDSLKSFEDLEMWLNEIKTKGNQDIQIILVGNKSDLEEKRQVTKEMTNEFCENNNIKVFLETSAKKGTNVKNVFLEAAKLLLEHHQKQKNTVYTTESMKNVLITNDLNEKDISREINFTQSDEEISTNKRKKKCC